MSAEEPLPPPELAPRSLESWLSSWRGADIPVLAETAETLALLAAREDDVDAHLLAQTVGADPLMTLRLLAHVGTHSRRVTDVETVTGALVLMGIPPFFRTFTAPATVEDRLADLPAAMAGITAVIARAHRAANFALGFAVHRMDHDAPVLHEAALLHDFAEMLLWCHAPQLALEIRRRQDADATLRSAAVQTQVLGIELAALQQALMRAWHLPDLLIKLDDAGHADCPAVRNVALAIRLARHTARGWADAAIPDDVHEIGELLRLGPEPTIKLLRELDDAEG